MFIDEQVPYWDWQQIRPEFRSDEMTYWIPISRRHSCWTFKPNPYVARVWPAQSTFTLDTKRYVIRTEG